MSFNREHMLRALELLPMWRQRAPHAVQVADHLSIDPPVMTAQPIPTQAGVQVVSPKAVAERPQALPVADADVAQKAVSDDQEALSDDQLAVSDDQLAELDNQVPNMPDANLQVIEVESAHTTMLKTIPDQAAAPPITSVNQIQTPWLFYAPDAVDAESQTLLLNIMKAMHLSMDMLTIQRQPCTLHLAAVPFIVLFGLDHANQFLGTAYTDWAEVEGQVFSFGQSQVVITHHPHEMRTQPACKRVVWQAVCRLLAIKV